MADKNDTPRKVRVFIEDHTGNKTREVRIAADVPVRTVLHALTTALQLPVTDRSGRQVTYHIAHGNQNLDTATTLHEAGVTDGTQLTIVPEMIAGGSRER